MVDVWIDDCSYGGLNLYRVMVDGKVYDELVSRTARLTHSQMIDVARGYEEALDSYIHNF